MVVNQWFPVFGAFHHLGENTRIPNFDAKLEAIQVNKGPTVPTRCEQNSNCLTLTLICERVADALGLDPIDVALKNDGAEGHDMEWLNRAQGRNGISGEGQPARMRGKGKGRHRMG